VCEFKVYPEAGHVFSDPDEEGQQTKPLTLKALLRMQEDVNDADKRISAFLERHLMEAPKRVAER
jgi:hypothetical protein